MISLDMVIGGFQIVGAFTALMLLTELGCRIFKVRQRTMLTTEQVELLQQCVDIHRQRWLHKTMTHEDYRTKDEQYTALKDDLLNLIKESA